MNVPWIPKELGLPRLVLLEQTPPLKEKDDDDMEVMKKRIHVVVKNVPFNVKLGVQQDPNTQVNLNHLVFEGKLLYDTEDSEDKEVDYVSVNPIELRRYVNQDGSEVKLQLRIKVLSSHHENLLFRVRIHATNPNSNRELTNMTVVTDPIKVISKPEKVKKTPSIKKKKNPEDQIREVIETIEHQQREQRQIVMNLQSVVDSYLNNSKSMLMMINGSGHHISNNNISSSGHNTIININNNINNINHSTGSGVASGGGSGSNNIHSSGSGSGFGGNGSGNNNIIMNNNNSYVNSGSSGSNIIVQNSGSGFAAIPPSQDTIFETAVDHRTSIPSSSSSSSSSFPDITSESIMFDSAFENFLIMYNTLNNDERPAKIRKIIRNSSHKDLENLSQFLEVLSTEGVKDNKQSCSCAICPYQYKLFQMERNYFPDADWDSDLPLV